MNVQQAALVYATFRLHTDVVAINGAGPNQGRIVYQGNNYDIQIPAEFLNYLKAVGTHQNPLKDDANEANRL